MPNVLTILLSALKATGIPFAAEAWAEKPTGSAYGVLSVDADNILAASDGIAERMFAGTVHLITFGDGYTEAAKVENVLNQYTDAYRPTSRRLINDIGAMHWQWSFEVI